MSYPEMLAVLTGLALVGWLSNRREPTFLGSVLVLSLSLTGMLADILLPADILLRNGAFGSVQIWTAFVELVLTLFLSLRGFAQLREIEVL